MAEKCLWADSQLQDDPVRNALPEELLHLIITTADNRYLKAIAAASLIPACTDRLFALYEPLIVESTAIWLRDHVSGNLSNDIAVLSALTRILPFAPYLKIRLKILLETSDGLRSLQQNRELHLEDMSDERLLPLLLAFFRLFSYDLSTFNHAISPTQLSPLQQHKNPSVRAIVVQLLGLYLAAADAVVEDQTQKSLLLESHRSAWEDISIDYRWLKIFEEERWKRLERILLAARSGRTNSSREVLAGDLLSPQTATIAGILLPRMSKPSTLTTSFVHTETADRNLAAFARALLRPAPVLLCGAADSGKTTIIREAARELNMLSTMISMNLNDQTDAKGLIGMYTTESKTGSFTWQAGVLTQAMQQGRWLLIEDLDRVPTEVVAVLQPVIEHNELMLPNRQRRLRASDGFRIFATSRITSAAIDQQKALPRSFLGSRLWNVLPIQPMPDSETAILLNQTFSDMRLHLPMVLRAHQRVQAVYSQNQTLENENFDNYGLRRLLKWCRRIQPRLSAAGTQSVSTVVWEQAMDDVLADGVDCYAGHLQSLPSLMTVAQCLAQEMHIPEQRMQHCLSDCVPAMSVRGSHVSVGRASISFSSENPRLPEKPRKGPFAATKHALRTMESILAAVASSEPLLLVGETGIGKTTLIQHLAGAVGQKLTVINLSQQSETSDLLGGLKPVTSRSLAIPLADTFAELFDDSFSAKKNPQFQVSVSRCITKRNWHRLLRLWQEAVQMAESLLQTAANGSTSRMDSQPLKKRRVSRLDRRALLQRWGEFKTRLQSFEAQLFRGNASFAFTYVEGRLVEAVRKGEWVLLDEINLASPETLESIDSLLDSSEGCSPYLLLPDAGNIRQITAHPNFRIFAAMNPANDAGKKDLAPAMRSRFTERFIQAPDNDMQDLMELIRSYLGDALNADERAAQDLGTLYLETKKLVLTRLLTDGAGDQPHFSIRSLVRCLLYGLQNRAVFGLRRALYEGFGMSFLTVLSRASEQTIISLMDQYLMNSHQNARSVLRHIPKVPPDSRYVKYKHHLLPPGPLEIQKQPHYIITAFVDRNLSNLARAASMRRFPILLQGPTSSGKTSMVTHLAKISGHHVVRINNHEHTDLDEYVGSYASDEDGRLVFREGVLVDALRKGHWIVLDELNLAPSDVLEALNRLLDDNRELLIPESQEIVRPHPNFMLFATQNPAGAYGGRKRLSRAFRNRFLEIHFGDIPDNELKTILQERSRIAPSYCTDIVSVYEKLADLRQSSKFLDQRNSFVTLRDLFRWALRKADDRAELARNGYMLLAERVRDSKEKADVKRVIEEVMRVKIDESQIYSTSKVPSRADLPRELVWTPAMRRLFVLVSNALDHNEPVLLIGETGCGKTQICQTIAEARGKHLQIYNAHVNTETGDLIGAQRPTRRKAEIEQQLRTNIVNVLGSPDKWKSASLDDLITAFEHVGVDSIDPSVALRIRSGIAHSRSLFEWIDGSLVSAMKAGDYFLLDEISLAEDAVLERLNSVLEPERTILLAEKGPVDPRVIAKTDFKFLATMNPGGDYGKRELSAALRNRLTEIWVPALTNEDDILPIVTSKLRTPVEDAAEIMVKFASWFNSHFQSASCHTVSLRNLLSWAAFICAQTNLDPHAAIVHGACMVFIDAIGANPAGMLAVSIEQIDTARETSLAKLADLLQYDVWPIYDEQLSLEFEDHVRVGPFSIKATSQRQLPEEVIFDAPTTLTNAMRLVRALQVSKAILLEGNPGVGKTAIVTALAQAAGKPLTRINLSDQTDLMDLFGADAPTEGEKAGSFSWRNGPFLTALQDGGWVLLDEMNLATQSVLEGLNSCLDHRQEVYISELDSTFTRHPDFALFAAQNPHHSGGGRKGLPASFVNRFTVVYVDAFNMKDLAIICQRRLPKVAASGLNNVLVATLDLQQRLSSRRLALGGPWEINLRDIGRALQLATTSGSEVNLTLCLEIILGSRLRSVEQQSALKSILSVIPKYDAARQLYQNLTPNTYQVGSAIVQRRIVASHNENHRRQLRTENLPHTEALMHCVNQSWPAILVGASGCGKSMLLKWLAGRLGAEVLELALNTDTDTMDLIGGFEQHDPQRAVSAFRQELGKMLQFGIVSQNQSPETLKWALELFHQCTIENSDLAILQPVLQHLVSLEPQFQTCLDALDAAVAESNKTELRFTWVDGPLVEALGRGCWVILDNANLCNPSVLDRLNSLLEPNGSLIISEQHNVDGKARVIKPHEDFRLFLTMDPSHGELSPAMRNRSLEIFTSISGTRKESVQSLSYPASSAISRLRLLPCDETDVEDTVRSEYTKAVLSHLSLWEHSRSALWREDLSRLTGHDLKTHIECYRAIPSQLLEAIQDFYVDLVGRSKLILSDVNHLPILPICLPPTLLRHQGLLERAKELSWLQSALIRLMGLHLMLLESLQAAKGLRLTHMTMLQLSSYPQKRVDSGGRSTPPFAAFLRAILTFLMQYLQSKGVCLPAPVRSGIDGVLSFLLDFNDFAKMRTQRAGYLQAFIASGRISAAELQRFDPGLAESINGAVALFNSDSQLKSGQSQSRLWQVWRPVTASTCAQLENFTTMKGVAQQLDAALTGLPGARLQYAPIRIKLAKAWTTLLHNDSAASSLLLDLQRAVDDLKIQMSTTKAVGETRADLHLAARQCLTGEFETFCQILDLHGRTAMVDEVDAVGLEILAGRPAQCWDTETESGEVPSTLCKIVRFAGWANESVSVHPLESNLASDLTKTAIKFGEQPLGRLDGLTEEVGLMIKVLSTVPHLLQESNVLRLKCKVETLLQSILDLHTDILHCKGLSIHDLADDSKELFGRGVESDHYFRLVFNKYLRPAAKLLSAMSGEELVMFAVVVEALFHVCLGFLHLSVPDQPSDPAIHIALRRERHDAHVLRLGTQLKGLKLFEKCFNGGDTNLQIEDVESKLWSLGDQPPPPNVVRPEQSQLALLHAEFQNLLRSVVNQQPEQFLTSRKHGNFNTTVNVEEVRILQQNIVRSSQRLSEGYPAYADLTTPIVRILQCLSFSIDVLLLRKQTAPPHNPTSLAIRASTPFLGTEPTQESDLFMSDMEELGPSSLTELSALDHSLHVQTILDVGHSPKHQCSQLLFIFDRWYQEWKTNLAQDQGKELKHSRYYSYRGGDEDDQEQEDADMAELFPTFEDDGRGSSDVKQKAMYDAKAVAQKLASLLTRATAVHDGDLDLSSAFGNALEILSRSVSNGTETPGSDVMLPGALIGLDQQLRSLQGTDPPDRPNIYSDANIAEARKLQSIAARAMLRATQISEAWSENDWSEHALPNAIVSCCKDILTFVLNDPVAKLLTKLQKLHELVSEFQNVASKEYSMSTLLDEITALVISWRRLELTSWSRLLDIELRKCQEDAQGWFFVVYESMIANPIHLLDAGDDLGSHAQGLLITLEDFLRNSNYGHYQERFDLVEHMNMFLIVLESQKPALRPLTSSVANLLQHYEQYGPDLQKRLAEERSRLDRNIQEQIKLASWKDTNVTSLRVSAKQSHHQLVKIVRKFRKALARPIESFGQVYDAKGRPYDLREVVEVNSWNVAERGVTAVAECDKELEGWQDRPARFNNPLGAASKMRAFLSEKTTNFLAHNEIASLHSSWSEISKELRSKTPGRQTDENQSFVQQLKAQKRRLFADVLKCLRHMGVRRNLGIEDLEKQKYTATVLSTTPSIVSSESIFDLAPTNNSFGVFLGYIPQVRSALREHTDELTHTDVARSVGMAEGLLMVIMRQRRVLGPALAHLDDLQLITNSLQCLQAPDVDAIVSIPSNNRNSDLIKQRLHSVPMILDLAIKILAVQARHGKHLNITNVVTCLESHSTRLRDLQKSLQKEETLPSGLTTCSRLHTIEKAGLCLTDLENEVRQHMSAEPRVTYLLKQILWWTSTRSDQPTSTNGVHSAITLQDFEEELCASIDKIYVAMQRMAGATSKATTSADEQGWLAAAHKSLATSVKAMHVDEVIQHMNDTLGRLRYISMDELPLAISLVTVLSPIIEQFYHICRYVVEELVALHYETCRMSGFLAITFVTIAGDGFCTPANSSANKQDKSSELDEGTGLGDGEGADDITKDIGKDEKQDLSELAQDAQREKNEDGIEGADDAIDMDQEDLEGDFDDIGEERQKDNSDDSEVEGEDPEPEVREDDVDELDPSAVDEKMWDGTRDVPTKQMENSGGEGQQSEEKTAGAEDNKQHQQDDDKKMEAGDHEAEESSIEDEPEAVGREETNQIDPHLQQEEALDLPDEMQLDGQKADDSDEISDNGLDALSDMDDKGGEEAEEAQGVNEVDADESDNQDEEKQDGAAAGSQPDEDAEAEQDEEAGDDHLLQRDDWAAYADETIGEETGAGMNAQDAEVDREKVSGKQSQGGAVNGDQEISDSQEKDEADGSNQQAVSGGHGHQRDTIHERQAEAFKLIGDILDEWHRPREIAKAADQIKNQLAQDEMPIADADFEHVADENDEGDTQALGAATKDQVRNLDNSKAIEDPDVTADDDHEMPDVDEEEDTRQPQPADLANFEVQSEETANAADETNAGAFVPGNITSRPKPDTDTQVKDEEAMQDIDDHLTDMQLASLEVTTPTTSEDEATRLWTNYSSSTHPLSLMLTEQLRLILAPTLATKLRGDFRTGKRLNIKRIIPYIASGYKRDKIWMRRSIPSKRNYQIMIAVDNSRSMAEGGAGALALEATALLCKSLSMLEVGQICVVGFGDGDHIRVAHPFDQPFNEAVGPRLFQNFGFRDTGTDVKKLVAESITLFRDAKRKSHRADAEQWQLELIISDGICEDHEGIRSLVREAQEERIMIVFVIVDAVAHGSRSSIMDLQQAVFEPHGEDGEVRITTKNYLRGFPFRYYLIVRDVRDLPGVLAGALKGWFREVVDVR